MATASLAADAPQRRTFTQKLLDGIENVGNKTPHPVMMFLYLIAAVILLSQILALLGVSVTEVVTEPVPYAVDKSYYVDTTQVQAIVPDEGNQYSDVQVQTREETIPIQ